MTKRFSFKKRSGEGTPMTLAIVLVLLIMFCAISEYAHLWIVAQGVKEATQDAILSTVNDNYDDVYHSVREGYAAGWFPDDSGWAESQDLGNVYGHLSKALGLASDGDRYVKYAGGQEEFAISNLAVSVQNNALGSGRSEGYTATATVNLEIPVRFLGNVLPPAQMTLHVQATYMPLF